jgi:hypothetical protein
MSPAIQALLQKVDLSLSRESAVLANQAAELAVPANLWSEGT